MADVGISRRATIEVPINADISKLTSANKALDSLTKQADQLKSTLDNVSKSFTNTSNAFEKYQSAISKVSSATKEALDNTEVFSHYKDAVVDNLDSVKKSFNGAGNASKHFAEKVTQATKDATDNQDKMRRMADSYGDVADRLNGSSEKVVRANEQLSRSGRILNQQRIAPKTDGVSRYASSVERATAVSEKFSHAGWTMLGVTAALGTSFLNGAKNAAAMQQSYNYITNLAVTSGEKRAAVLKNVAAMQKENTDLSVKYGIAQTDLAKGDEELVHAGYSTNAALAAHKVLVQGAIATNQSYGDVMNNVTSIMDQYGLRTNNVNKMSSRTKQVMNEMAYSVDHSKSSFNDFGEAMKYVGSTSHSTNQQLSGTMSALAVLSRNGQGGSEAGTGLRKVLDSFGAAGKGMGGAGQKTVMNQLGLTDKDFHDAKGNLLQLGDLMKLMRDRMQQKGLSNGQIFSDTHQFFGTTGQETALILEKNADAIGKLNDQVARSEKMKGGGYVQWLSGKNMQTATNQINVFKQAWNAFDIATANTILPALTGGVKWLDKLLLGVNKLSPTGKSVVAWSAVIVAAISPIMFVMGNLRKAINLLTFGSVDKLIQRFKTPIDDRFTPSINKSTEQIANDANQDMSASERIDGSAQNIEAARSVDNNGINMSRSEYRSATKWGRFKSRFGGIRSTGTHIGQVADDAHLASSLGRDARGVSRLGMLGKAGGVLSIGTSLLGLIGMNSSNQGQKLGNVGGSMLGGALGTLLDPYTFGLGSMGGAMLGGWLGDKFGRYAQHKPQATHSTQNSIDSYSMLDERKYDQSMMRSYNKRSSEYKKYAADYKRITDKMYADNNKSAKKAYSKDEANLQYMLKHKEISQSKYEQLLKKAQSKETRASKQTNANILKDYNTFSKKLKGASTSQAAVLISNVVKTRNKQVTAAKTAYNNTIDKDKKTRDKQIDLLKEYGQAETTEGQKKIKEIDDRYDKQKKAAENLKNNQIKAATTSADKVIDQANRQHKNLTSNVNEETGQLKNLMYYIDKIGGFFKHAMANAFTKGSIDGTNVNVRTGRFGGRRITAHANGGAINQNAMALVGEQGPELAYNPKSSQVRILGANGPQMTRVLNGEHILTAYQTAKVLASGLGKNRVLDGFAKGTGDVLGAFANGTGLIGAKTTFDDSKNQKQFRDNNAKSLKNINKDTKKSNDALSDQSNKQFSDMYTALGKLTDTMHSTLIKKMNSFESDWKAVLALLPKDAQASMQSVVNALNQGISGIDNSLQQFGGNSSVLKPFHYANGSDGALTSDQLAMVNDAKVGPKQEAIVRNGDVFLPKFNDQLMRLKKGDQVLNGRQTQKLIQNQTINHYAKGSGVSDSALQSLADKNAKDPDGYFQNSFTNKAKPEGPTLEQGLTGGITNAIKSTGKAWSSAMWNLIQNTITGGGGSGSLGAFLNYAEKIGMGKKYVMGATGPDAFDCSGLVYTALKHFGITIGRNTVAEQADPKVHYLGKDISKAQVGDLAIFGHGGGANGHVGIISNTAKGLMMNATPPSGRISSIKAAEPYVPGGLAGYYHVAGLSAANKDSSKGTGLLDKLVKSELGSHALSWITNHLGESDQGGGAGGDSPAPTGSHKHWLEQAGIAAKDYGAANYIISHESGWNPHAVDPNGGAYGLPQSLPGDKMAAAGADWRNNPITQLKWMKSYVDHTYGGFQQAQAYWEKNRAYANGGWANRPSTFGEIPGEPEVAINPKRASADRLICEAIAARAKATGRPLHNLLQQRQLRAKGKAVTDRLAALFTKRDNRQAKPQVIIQPTFNFTVNGNMDKSMAHYVQKLVEQTIQKVAYNANNSMGMNNIN